MPFLYFFSLRSNMVYLSRGSISASVGISAFHVSSALSVSPCRASALSSVSTTASTARRRSRWRAFWNRESLQGIFLQFDKTKVSGQLLYHFYFSCGPPPSARALQVSVEIEFGPAGLHIVAASQSRGGIGSRFFRLAIGGCRFMPAQVS